MSKQNSASVSRFSSHICAFSTVAEKQTGTLYNLLRHQEYRFSALQDTLYVNYVTLAILNNTVNLFWLTVLLNEHAPKRILELGTFTGLTTYYLSLY